VWYGPADSAAPNEPSLNLVQDHYRYEDQIVINLQPEQSPIPLPNFYVFLSTLNTLHDQLVLIEVLCMDKNCLNQILLIDFLPTVWTWIVGPPACRKAFHTCNAR
jgi:hypothetical protein